MSRTDSLFAVLQRFLVISLFNTAFGLGTFPRSTGYLDRARRTFG